MTKLGQHFLKSKKIVEEIVKAAEIKTSDIVLEVGPGKGVLTEALLEKAGRVIAIEKDKQLVQYLKNKFRDCKNLELITGDILKIENLKLIKNCKLKIENFKVVANIPYYITSRFLRNFLTAKNQPELMVLMLQKEVAERIVAKDKKESLLSISVKAYGQPKITKTVPAKYFSPKPKVDSAIIKIENISRNFFNYRYPISIVEERFFDLVRKGFTHKRKLLKNNLGISENTLKQCGLSEKTRSQELSLENWKCLFTSCDDVN